MSNNYLKEDDFFKEIEISLEKNKLTDNAFMMYKSLVENMIRNKKYNQYPQEIRANMQNTAYCAFLKYWRGYDINKGKAFSYFSRTCENAFVQEINRYYRDNKRFALICEAIKGTLMDGEQGVDDDYNR